METFLLTVVLSNAIGVAAAFVLVPLTVASPRAWYRRLRYGSPRPVIILDTEAGVITVRGFHPHGEARVAREVYLLRDTFPGIGPTPRALALLHCPCDLMPFLQGDDRAGWLIELR